MNISAVHRRRWSRFPDIGCVACRIRGRVNDQVEVHHLLSGGRRRGHDDSIPLCVYHHRGAHPDYTWARDHLGPSLAHEPREFRAEFGSDDTLLAMVNKLLERFA